MINNHRVDTGDEQSSRILKAIKNSAIIKALSKFAGKIYQAVASSVFGSVLASREKTESKFDASISKKIFEGTEKSIERTKKVKYSFAKRIEQSAVINVADRARAKIMRVSLSSYGVFLFSFGFYSSIVYAIKRFALESTAAPSIDLFTGLGCIVFSLFFFASKKSLSGALSTSRIIRAVFSDFIGFRMESVDRCAAEPSEQYVGIPFLIGTLMISVSL